MPSPPAGKTSSFARRARQLLCVWLLFVLYAGTFSGLSDGRILGNDAIPYAVELSRGVPHANPHHLAFHPLAAGAEALLEPFADDSTPARSPMGLAMTAHVLVSALGGALAAWFFFRAALLALSAGTAPTRKTVAAAFTLTCCLAFSATHWLYAATGETYLPAIAAELAVLGLCLGERINAPQRDGFKSLIPIIAALLAAVLLRQDSVIVCAPILMLLNRKRAKLVIASAGAIALCTYFAAWSTSTGDASFRIWLTGLANSGLWGAAPSWLGFKVAAFLTLTALTYPLHFVGQALLYGDVTQQIPALLLAAAPWLFLVASPLVAARNRITAGPSPRSAALRAVLAFATLRFLFFFWWQPSNIEYHTGTLGPLFLALALWLGQKAIAWRQVLIWSAAAILIMIGNWQFLMGPSQGNQMHERSLQAIELAGPDGLVVSLDQLSHYAIERAIQSDPSTDQPKARDAGLLANGQDLSNLANIRRQIETTLANGEHVIGIRDLILPARFDNVPWHLDWSKDDHEGGMNMLLEGYNAQPIPTDTNLQDAWLFNFEVQSE